MIARVQSHNFAQTASRWSIVAVAVSVFVCALVWHNPSLLGVSAVILCFILRRAWDTTAKDASHRATHGGRKHEINRTARSLRNSENEFTAGNEQDPAAELADAR